MTTGSEKPFTSIVMRPSTARSPALCSVDSEIRICPPTV